MVTINTITTNIINNGLIIGIVLISFLVFKEVFSGDINENKKIQFVMNIINITIVPLTLVFMVIVAYKAITVLSTL
jgi:hypothetical protein